MGELGTVLLTTRRNEQVRPVERRVLDGFGAEVAGVGRCGRRQPAHILDDRLRHRQSPAFAQNLRKVFPVNELQYKVMRAGILRGIEGGHNVRMDQPRGGAHFFVKPVDRFLIRQRLGGQHLDSDLAFHPPVPRPQHDAHPAFAQFVEDRVLAKLQSLMLALIDDLCLILRQFPLTYQ